MFFRKSCLVVGLFLSCIVCGALQVGDKAPPLKIAQWLNSKPVNMASGKGEKVYVVELWATWCAPCKASIKFLNRYAEEYKGKLVIVAITTEAPAAVKKFMKTTPMDYSVAIDARDQTSKMYMKGRSGIPKAFIINSEGVVAWIGHSLEMDKPLRQIIAGRYSVKQAQEDMRINRKIKYSFQRGDYNSALLTINAALKKRPNDMQLVSNKVYMLFLLKKREEALAYVEKKLPENANEPTLYKLKILILKAMRRRQELAAAYEAFIKKFSTQPMVLNDLADRLLKNKQMSDVPLAVALEAAETAYTKGKFKRKLEKAIVADTLARCYYLAGRLDKAIEIQKVSCRILEELKSQNTARAKKMLSYYLMAYNLGKKLK